MNSLRTLGALIVGAIILAAVYGSAFSGRKGGVDIEISDEEGVRQVVKGDRGSFALKQDGLMLEASWRGDYDLTDAGDGVAALDYALKIVREQNGREEKVVFENDDNEIESVYYLNGEKQDENPETQEAKRALLTAFLEASGAKAEERVESLLREGGPPLVIEKIGAMYSDHARLRYVTELTKQAELSGNDVTSLLSSLKNIEGDHDLRVALDALLQSDSVSAREMPAFLESATRIENDYDLRRLIESVSEQGLNADAIGLAIGLLERLESDHDLRRASEALLEHDNISGEQAARLVETIGERIESDHDLRLILSDAAPYLAGGAKPAAAWLSAFGSLSSDHDRRLVLEEAAKLNGLSNETLMLLIAASEKISSDHDRRLVLEAYADSLDDDEALQAAYVQAAHGISSDSERERVLAAAGLND